MFGITVSARVLALPVATVLVSIGFAALVPPHHAPKQVVVKPIVPEPAPVVVPPAPVPVIDPELPFDLIAALQPIARRALPHTLPVAEDQPRFITAQGECARPTARQQATLKKQLATWVDHTYADEAADAATGLELAFGCDDPTGLIVNAHVDRKPPGVERATQSRWWILRVRPDAVTMLAQRTSSAVDDWMEWADEGTLGAGALVDLDRDGVRDVLAISTEHEGGATSSDYTVSAMLSKTATSTPIVEMHGQLELQLVGHEVVLGLGDNYEHLAYRCIGADLKLATCAGADRLRTQREIFEIATRYLEMTPASVPDRDQLAGELATLGVSAAERAPLLAAAPETTPARRAQRDVARFVAKVGVDDDLGAIVQSSHDEAQAYFGAIRSQLGDATCATPAPSEADTVRVTAWIAAQPSAFKGKHEAPTAIAIAPACGPYTWAAWEEWKYGDNRSTGTRHEALLVLGDDITRVVGFDFPATGDPQMGPGTAHVATFFRHGNAIVGEVIHSTEDRTELLAIADAHVVAKRKGAFERYTYDGRWTDASDDLIVDPAAHAWWHATPAGLERIDPEPLQAHEARRAALQLLADYDPSQVELKTEHVRALRTLGADRALVREVRDL